MIKSGSNDFYIVMKKCRFQINADFLTYYSKNPGRKYIIVSTNIWSSTVFNTDNKKCMELLMGHSDGKEMRRRKNYVL